MATDNEDTNTDAPDTSKPPPSADPPDWVADLKRTIEELPGKLRASVTDDDKNGIAEAVHGLFERSGAFEHETQSTKSEESEVKDDEREADKETQTEQPPAKGSKLSGFARWFAGEG